ncbi:MAG: DUF2087 domain-containing protein [Chloroflexi bacterium]|jgi:hypothetical protein|nr:DUF2087 domain-containing protein [Chloroflexota bacterium]MBT3670978.1 DUF2087 domain-containing protein [Chloroflexota bacterium]MBT4001745.1 DUF2087 domain-containing protein [Chloroflexota bacterium]MBT4305011.1 DUF2087 domain-containing protein [Chloroflexota bacterium]MBT4533822.1 DUF2087 domain-containing protein [Chloroflexota bacterium]
MDQENSISEKEFIKRLVNLCLKSGLQNMPKKPVDQHVLFKSVTLLFDSSGSYSQKEVDEKLQYWLLAISQFKKIDHVSLRRYLIDATYLERSSDGTAYTIPLNGQRQVKFEGSINDLDIERVLSDSKEEIDKKKQAFLSTNKSN